MVQRLAVVRSQPCPRETIIRASVELGSELGEEGLTMRGLASRLGVNATALYHQFDGKAAILREIRFYGVDRLWEAVSSARELDSPAARLSAMGERYVQFAIEHPWLYSVLMEHEEIDWSRLSPDEVDRMIKPLRFVHETLADGKQRGVWGPALNVEMAAMRMWTAMHGLCSLITNGRIDERHPVFPVTDQRVFVREFIEAVVSGLAIPASPG